MSTAPGWYADLVKPGAPPRHYVYVAKADGGTLTFASLLHGRLLPLHNVDTKRFVSDIEDGLLQPVKAPPKFELLDGWYLEPDTPSPTIVSISEFTREEGETFYQVQLSEVSARGKEDLFGTRSFRQKAAAVKWLHEQKAWASDARNYVESPEYPPTEATGWASMLTARKQEAEERERQRQQALAEEERMRRDAAARKLRERLATLLAESPENLSTDEFAEMRRLKRQLRGAA